MNKRRRKKLAKRNLWGLKSSRFGPENTPKVHKPTLKDIQELSILMMSNHRCPALPGPRGG